MHSPTELSKTWSPFRNLRQVRSNRIFKHCNGLTSASIVLMKPQAFWCHGAQATTDVEMHVPPRPGGADGPFMSGIPHAFLETPFLWNQFPNELMMIYKPGIWFLPIVCKTLHCSVAPRFSTGSQGDLGLEETASVVKSYWLGSRKLMC